MEKIKVLIVEDEIIVAKHIEDSLLSLGYSVTGIVSSGEDTVEHAADVQAGYSLDGYNARRGDSTV